MRLKDKIAINTGAASGIAKDIADRFAGGGAKIAIVDLRQDAAVGAAVEIRSCGGDTMGVSVDVADEDAVNAGAAAVVAEFGGVDILVSNAGIQIVHPIEEFPAQRDDRSIVHREPRLVHAIAPIPKWGSARI